MPKSLVRAAGIPGAVLALVFCSAAAATADDADRKALENPTCRWSTWDAIKAGVEPRPALQATIQERAWSSPIWIGGPPTR